ncbi:MAG: hypothetical protein GF384_00530, partial [Elusimicrobia bacterium]|nr:hypothetical protein [Elusimicrobiota bacterium]MBD3411574.1 hypothetical protein [Elusimicrobiota bacterium]
MKTVCTYVAVVVSCVMSGQLFAGEVDMLIKKLAEKNVITYGEAQKLITETNEQVRMQLGAGTYPGAPKWSQKFKLKGDLRLRQQSERKDNNERRNRWRMRYRLGIIAQISQGFEAAAGLATGGTDPRSTNQTLENGFSTKPIQLDYAYVSYMPIKWITFRGGKYPIKTALWKTGDLMWDSDIAVEGFGANLVHKVKAFELFFNGGYYVLDEFKNSGSSQMNNPSDPYMVFAQPGAKYSWTKLTYVKLAPHFYGFEHVKGEPPLPSSEGGNTRDANGNLKYDYDTVGASIEIGCDMIPFLPWHAIFAEYVKNSDPDNEDMGILAGAKIGDKKVGDRGQWQAKYNYRQLEADAWVDA